MLNVPLPTDRHVLGFCHGIRAGSLPYLVSVQPDVDAEQLDCFANVRRVVDRLGGSILYGWGIWEWPRIYIEAEHHAVYQPPNGLPIDVTPPLVSGTAHTLFLPDDSAIYDFKNEGIRRNNHRLALRSDPLIEELFQTKKAFDELQNEIPGVGLVKTDPKTFFRIREIERKYFAAASAIAKKFLGRNDPCFCSSGKKYKKCHGKSERR